MGLFDRLFGRGRHFKKLLDAAAVSDVAAARKALDDGADPNAREPEEGQTPLHIALRGYRKPTSHGPVIVRASIRPEALSAMVDLLIEAGAAVSAADTDGVTPLHWATGYALQDMVHKLLTAGANVNAEDKFSITPLHQAVDAGSIPIIQMLLDAGANINARNIKGQTPLAIAEGKRVMTGLGEDLYKPIRSFLRERGAIR